MEKEIKANEVSKDEMAEIAGGYIDDPTCGHYQGKPGTHMIDDYGKCYSCIHDHNGNCDLRK